MEHHQDEHITCAECGTTFVFTAAEADSFASKRLDPPKRCFECRRARRAQRDGAQRDGGPRDSGPRHMAPRGQFGGDVNGYRSPMSDPGAPSRSRQGEYRAPGFRDARPAGNDGRQGGFRGAPQGGQQGGPQGGFRGEYRAPSFGGEQGPRGGGDYRAPSFGGDRGARPGFRSGPPGGGFRSGPPGGGGRPEGRGGPGGPRGPRGEGRPSFGGGQDQNAQGGDRAPRRAQAERPSYPITCAQCGAASEVPFKPLEGREILCRTCYRAKKDAG